MERLGPPTPELYGLGFVALYAATTKSGRTRDWNGAPVRTFNADTNATYWQLEGSDAFGNHTEYTTGAVARTRSFERLTGRLSVIEDVGAHGGIIGFNYEYNNVGGVSLRGDAHSGITWRYGYDGARQLTWVKDADTGVWSDVEYDGFGNIERKPGTEATLSNWGMRLTRVDGDDGVTTVPVYDASGQITAIGERSIEYGEFGQPVNIEQQATGARVVLAYDAEGAVSVAEVNAPAGSVDTSGRFVSVGDEYQKVFVDGAAQAVHRHFIGEDVLVVVSPSGTSAYNLHRDGLGSLYAVSDEDGVVLSRQEFDAWGMPTTLMTSGRADIDVGQTCSVGAGFTGHTPLAAVGLIHMNARVYDPSLGRFLSPDSIIPGTLPLELHRYAYGLNSPLVYTDPTGHLSRVQWGGLGQLGLGLIKVVGGGVALWTCATGVGCVGAGILIADGLDDFHGGGLTLRHNERRPGFISQGVYDAGRRANMDHDSAAAMALGVKMTMGVAGGAGAGTVAGAATPSLAISHGGAASAFLGITASAAVVGSALGATAGTLANAPTAAMMAQGAESSWNAANGGNSNKYHHIFGKEQHNLDGVVRYYGSEEAAYNALHRATQAKMGGTNGVFETTVRVAGQNVTVRGCVIDGVIQIGTAFIP